MKPFKGLLSASVQITVFWLIFACNVHAQPVAKITGPTQVPPGELTAISALGSSGDNLLWIQPEGLTTILAGCEVMDSTIFFSTTREGSYEFILVCSDKEARMAYGRHTVVVGKPTPPPTDPPPGPTPPTDPPPGPTPGKWSGMVDLSKANAELVNDPATRPKLKQAINDALASIKKRCDAGQCPGLPQCKAEVTAAIENTLLTRSDRFSKWAELWRIPNNNFIQSKGLQGVPDYLEAVKAFAAGL